jgi:hypothetical protein
VTVVGGAHEHAGADAGGRRRARDRAQRSITLERAQAAGGLDQRVEAVARGRGGGAVGAGRRASGVGRRAGRPALLHDHLVDRGPLRPSRRLEPGPHRSLVGPAQTEVGHGVHAGGDAEERAQVVGPVEAHPAHAQPLGAGRQPQVLDRARGAVDVGLEDRPPPQHLRVGVAVVTADDDAERRLDHPIFWSRN